MKIIHTSDWHLGRSLYTRKRYEEFAAFLDWLGTVVEDNQIDALLVSGDIFDNSTPGNRAQQLYYRFLSRIAQSNCNQVVIVAGNHDSPSFLNAPKELLHALNVHVVGSITDNYEDEIVVLKNKDNQPAAIVCAVPYLRDKDIRTATTGESIEDKNHKLIEGIKNHYTHVCEIAAKKREEIISSLNSVHSDSDIKDLCKSDSLPLIAMGHLFTAEGKTVEGDGVRELYVGSLAHVKSSVFPDTIDYLALGHLHVPQKVGNSDVRRYSGSPIPMGFGEAKQTKKVILAEFIDNKVKTEEIDVPCFQKLERISGNLLAIRERIECLNLANSESWLEIEYTGSEIVPNLKQEIETLVTAGSLKVLRIKNKPVIDKFISITNEGESLVDIDEYEVFERCLAANDVPSEEKLDLIECYKEILHNMQTGNDNSGDGD